MTATETENRKSGRTGRRRGPNTTREALLQAGLEAFAEHGYGSANVRQIATAAGVDPALIHHFFQTKAGLFEVAVGLSRWPAELAMLWATEPDELSNEIMCWTTTPARARWRLRNLAVLRSMPTAEEADDSVRVKLVHEVANRMRCSRSAARSLIALFVGWTLVQPPKSAATVAQLDQLILEVLRGGTRGVADG